MSQETQQAPEPFTLSQVGAATRLIWTFIGAMVFSYVAVNAFAFFRDIVSYEIFGVCVGTLWILSRDLSVMVGTIGLLVATFAISFSLVRNTYHRRYFVAAGFALLLGGFSIYHEEIRSISEPTIENVEQQGSTYPKEHFVHIGNQKSSTPKDYLVQTHWNFGPYQCGRVSNGDFLPSSGVREFMSGGLIALGIWLTLAATMLFFSGRRPNGENPAAASA